MQQFFTSNIRLRDFLSIKNVARNIFENIIKVFKIDQTNSYENFNTASSYTRAYHFTSDRSFDVDLIKSFWLVVDHMYINFNQNFFVFFESRFFSFHKFSILFFVSHNVREWIFRKKTISKMIFLFHFNVCQKTFQIQNQHAFFVRIFSFCKIFIVYLSSMKYVNLSSCCMSANKFLKHLRNLDLSTAFVC